MSKRSFYPGDTSKTIDVFFQDTSSTVGAGLTGLTYTSFSSGKLYYRKGPTGSATSFSLATQTVGGAWSSGGFVEISSTNMPGLYRLDLPDAMLSTEATVVIYMDTGTGLALPVWVELEVIAKVANVKELGGSSTSANMLKAMCDSGVTGAVVSDAGNGSASFKTNLSSSTDDFWGDSTNGGAVLVFTSGSYAGQGRRVTAYNGTSKFITLETGLAGTPSASDTFVIVGRIEAP